MPIVIIALIQAFVFIGILTDRPCGNGTQVQYVNCLPINSHTIKGTLVPQSELEMCVLFCLGYVG